MIQLFRRVAFVEGVTTLVLFLVAMPLKYFFGRPFLITPVGWLHGIAFIAYTFFMVAAFRGRGINLIGWLRTFAAAFVPFGTFVNDGYVSTFMNQNRS